MWALFGVWWGNTNRFKGDTMVLECMFAGLLSVVNKLSPLKREPTGVASILAM